MRGYIHKKNGRFYPSIASGRDSSTGKRRRTSLGGFRTKREAHAAITKALGDLDQGMLVEPTRVTLGDFLLNEWLPAIRSTVRPSTFDSYRLNIERHVVPRLGLTPLQKLRPAHLNKMYAELLEEGRVDRNGGLAPKTVNYVHVILHRALRDAVRWNLLQRNVATQADPPRSRRKELQTWTQSEVLRFLDQIGGDRLYAAYLLSVITGMRRGEVLGLRWGDIDLDLGRAQIRQTLTVVDNQLTFSEPKTRSSTRSTPLDVDVITALRSHRVQQMREHLALGSDYATSDLVFTNEDGSPVHPRSLSRRFCRHASEAGLPMIRFHDLRHTWASLALLSGVHPKFVSHALGHSSIATTLDIYSHVLPAMEDEAAAKIASVILGRSGS